MAATKQEQFSENNELFVTHFSVRKKGTFSVIILSLFVLLNFSCFFILDQYDLHNSVKVKEKVSKRDLMSIFQPNEEVVEIRDRSLSDVDSNQE